MNYTSRLSVEILQTILGYVPQEHLGAFLQTSQYNYSCRGYSLYRHVDISYQNPQQIFHPCALSFSADCISMHARSLFIDTSRLRLLPRKTPEPLNDLKLVLQWVARLFPDPPTEKRTPDILAQCGQGRREWIYGFFRSGISTLLVSILLVNRTNLLTLWVVAAKVWCPHHLTVVSTTIRLICLTPNCLLLADI
ncbi:hypothetical protein PSV08DRAFT_186974 [Bipolaris maydis]|uniref:uncharacterized protein n=1 Tax=Cochliobolus heterostrophus TaxID=5016 RepID=UPI0024D33CAA|nr:hypothetical protein PSV08DRAFT_186742 [Bipolaris maydis]KAJ6267562.1 hypothetical protein PSV08DRAFT_186974 [Bipolaris maydis]